MYFNFFWPFSHFASPLRFNLSLLFVILSNEHVFFHQDVAIIFYRIESTMLRPQIMRYLLFVLSHSICMALALTLALLFACVSLSVRICGYLARQPHSAFFFAIFANINWIGVLCTLPVVWLFEGGRGALKYRIGIGKMRSSCIVQAPESI